MDMPIAAMYYPQAAAMPHTRWGSWHRETAHVHIYGIPEPHAGGIRIPNSTLIGTIRILAEFALDLIAVWYAGLGCEARSTQLRPIQPPGPVHLRSCYVHCPEVPIELDGVVLIPQRTKHIPDSDVSPP